MSLGADRKTVTFTPLSPLKNNTLYQWNVSGVQDQEGNGESGGGSFVTGLNADHAAPTIVSTNPPNGAQNVAVNVAPSFRAIEPLNILTVNGTSVMLKAGQDVVTGTVTLLDDRQTIRFQPASLSGGVTYTATITGIADIAGNVIAPFNTSFTTAASVTPDGTGPSVVSINPANNDTGVATNSPIVVTFNENIDPLSVSGNTVAAVLHGNQYHFVGTYSVDNTTTQGKVTFIPLASSPYPPGSTIDVKIEGVRDYAGNGNSTFQPTTFDTVAGIDSVAPTVTSVSPPDFSTGIGTYAFVTLTFSKALDPSTLTESSLGLVIGGVPQPAPISHAQDSTAVVLGPAYLPQNTTVNVVATREVKDLSGNRLVPFSSQFTTGSADSETPRITNPRPSYGATDVPLNTPITLFFTKPMSLAATLAALKVSQNGVLISGTAALTGGNQVLTFTPGSPYLPGATIEVFVRRTAVDTSGIPISDYSLTFTTLPDTTTVLPAVNAHNLDAAPFGTIPINPVIEIQYNKPLATATVNDTNVTLVVPFPYANIPSQVSLRDGNTIRIVPNSPLSPGVSYYYSASIGVRDQQGNIAPAFGSFTAGPGPVDNSHPRVDMVSPPDQSQGHRGQRAGVPAFQ